MANSHISQLNYILDVILDIHSDMNDTLYDKVSGLGLGLFFMFWASR
uniref:Uncharacterized protein n=1 Tax=Anguilla anguilla TaxID=7936 RepID=A0A0E9TZ67_ANGAN